MSQRRTWVVGAALLTVVLVVGSYFLLLGPKRSQAADLRTQTDSQRQTNSQLQLDIARLKSQFASLPAKQAELAVIRQQMPGSPNLPTIVRNLTTIANESGVVLSTIAPATPTAVVGNGTATATAATTATGLFQIPVTVSVQGDYASAELFLQKIQTEMRRVYLVQSLSIAPASGDATDGSPLPDGAVSLNLSGDVFVLQASATTTGTTVAGTTAAGTTAAGTPAAGATGTTGSTTTPASGSAN